MTTTNKHRETFQIDRGSTLGRTDVLMSDATRWGDLVFLSGRAAVDPATGTPAASGFEAQARLVMEDIARALDASGSSLEHVLRVECWLASATDFQAWNDTFSETFSAPRPARTTLVSDFALPGLLIEVQVTAGVPS